MKFVVLNEMPHNLYLKGPLAEPLVVLANNSLASHVLSIPGHVLISPKKRKNGAMDESEDTTPFGDLGSSDDNSDEDVDVDVEYKFDVNDEFYKLFGVNDVCKGTIVARTVALSTNKPMYEVRYMDNTHEQISEFEMRALMLNGPNGKLFTHMDEEFVVVEIKGHRIPEQTGKRTVFDAESYQFNVLYEGRKNGSWQAYNSSLFEVAVMKSYLKTTLEARIPGIYKKFELHYKKNLRQSVQQYKYVPSHNGENACIKVTRGNGFVDTLDIPRAEYEFGEDVVAKIIEQHDSLSNRAKPKIWFHAGSGTPTTFAGCLVKKSTDESITPFEDAEPDYMWNNCPDWFKIRIIKTRGCYCFMAAVINSLDISELEAIAMFHHFAPHHNSVGEIEIPRACNILKKYAMQLTSFKGAFVVKKLDALLSFEQFFHISKEEKNIWIVFYNTVNNSTHSITWDSHNNKILDPDNNSSNVYTYNSVLDFKSEDLCLKLQTVFEVPCILNTAYWRRKSPHNRKRKKAKSNVCLLNL